MKGWADPATWLRVFDGGPERDRLGGIVPFSKSKEIETLNRRKGIRAEGFL
jgi:hypothetical protein